MDTIIPLPVTNPTCLCFGGDDLKTLSRRAESFWIQVVLALRRRLVICLPSTESPKAYRNTGSRSAHSEPAIGDFYSRFSLETASVLRFYDHSVTYRRIASD
ncbi:hypothetical protein [Bradyrhizobium iriomotense]|uniref:hypothetical protein n=1 Tax=Bradyrhizobium iriomotense TaxID=441950 RepID=UPI0032DE8F30